MTKLRVLVLCFSYFTDNSNNLHFVSIFEIAFSVMTIDESLQFKCIEAIFIKQD
jgi:hypothetical protein